MDLNNRKTSNVIFDLGGVILDIDYDLTTAAFVKLGIENFKEVYSQKKQQHFFDDFEKGVISRTQFFDEVRVHLPEGIRDKQIEDAWNAMLLKLPASRIEWLRKVGLNHRIFLLSNTNEIHIEAFRKILQDDFGGDVLADTFEKCYYSSEVGMRKPDKDVFHRVLQENGLDPTETMFIDDSPQHVEGAKVTGIHSVLLEKGNKVEEQFSFLLT
jgi:putative hydrolase of the HAD superfamily